MHPVPVSSFVSTVLFSFGRYTQILDSVRGKEKEMFLLPKELGK